MSNLEVFLFDKFNNSQAECSIIKPYSYQDLLIQLRQKFPNIPEYFELFIIDINNKEIKIDSQEKYSEIQDVLFLRQVDKSALEKSLFQRNFEKLSESNQDILNEKFNCNICSIIIKNEKPYLCYKCQNIFHEKCLKDWDKQCKSSHKKLICPNCRNQLPIEKWNKKLNYEENRNEDANLMNIINNYKLNEKFNNKVNMIKDKKIKELEENEIKKNELITKYEEYFNKTIKIFKNILNKINSMNDFLNLEKNYKLNNLINKYSLNLQNLNLDEVSNMFNEELDKFMINLKKDKNINNFKEIIDINKIEINGIKNDEIKDNEEYKNSNNENINIIQIKNNELFINEKVNKINLIYSVKTQGNYNIFGNKFIENNKENLKLIINSKETVLDHCCELNKGNNIISIVVKKNITNLNSMFYGCEYLKDISDLKYLDVNEVKDCSYMFYKCSSISDIKALENWDLSNCNNFKCMFYECPLLSDIKPLKNWNVSNGEDLSYLFFGCSSLIDITPLENWNVSNCKDFSYLFKGCSSLIDIKPLEKWNFQMVKNLNICLVDVHH